MRAPPTVLLLGSTGQVGSELLPLLRRRGPVVAPTRAELDLMARDAVRDAVRATRPAAIVNAAAATDVDGAERDPATALALNAHLVRVLAEEAVRAGSLLVHYSTDYVFDGEASTPYRETDAPRPVNTYGATKLAGEEAIAAVGGPHLVLRTSWVFGRRGRNFLSTMLRLARERAELHVVCDQTSRPTWSRRVAEATDAIVARVMSALADDAASGLWGVYHLAGGGDGATKYDFAVAALGRGPGPVPVIHPVPSAEFPAPARRPRYSVLDTTKVAEAFGVVLPDWREDVARALAEREGPAGATPSAAARSAE